jgi:hypothetical protein
MTTLNIPHPSAKPPICASLAFIESEKVIDKGKRIVLKFAKRKHAWENEVGNPAQRQLYDSDRKIALYIYQKGRASVIWLDDSLWKITKRKRLAPSSTVWDNPKKLKVDIKKLDLTEEHFEAIQKSVEKYL